MASDIYAVLKNQAASGRYVRAELAQKIDRLWVEGKLTDAQRAELIDLAESCVDPNYTPMTEAEKALDERLFAVEAAMLDVGGLIALLMTGGEA